MLVVAARVNKLGAEFGERSGMVLEIRVNGGGRGEVLEILWFCLTGA